MLCLLNVCLYSNSIASVCKCDHSLSHFGEYKKSLISGSFFFFATDHTHIFCSSLSWGISKKSCKEIWIPIAQNLCFKKTLFPIIEEAWFWKRANLSTLRHLTNQSMIPESDIMEGRHQRHASWLCSPFPLNPDHHLACFAHRYFSYFTQFLPFSPTAEQTSCGMDFLTRAIEIPDQKN